MLSPLLEGETKIPRVLKMFLFSGWWIAQTQLYCC